MCAGALYFCSQEEAFNHERGLCCSRSRRTPIPLLKNTANNNLTPAFCFSGKSEPSLVQLALTRRVSAGIFALASLFILAARSHTPQLRESAEPHGSRRLSSNAAQGEGAGRRPPGQKQLDLDPDWPAWRIAQSSSVCSPSSSPAAAHYVERRNAKCQHLLSRDQSLKTSALKTRKTSTGLVLVSVLDSALFFNDDFMHETRSWL